MTEEQIIERAKDLYPKLLPFATYICGYAYHDNDGTPKETIQKYLAMGANWQKEAFLKILDQWEAHAIRGMKTGAAAFHQGKIALITDLKDWINKED